MAIRCIAFLLCFVLGSAAGAATPDVDEIVRRHLTAIGGAARWGSVDSLVVRGNGTFGSFTWVWKRPDKVRTEERDGTAGGRTLVTAFDGAVGWTSNPFIEAGPQKLGVADLKRWQTGLAIRSDLLDLPAEGVTLSLLGREKVGGRDAYKLSLKRAGRNEVLLWIDAESYLLVQRARTAIAPWGELRTMTTALRDYRAVNGVMIPHAIGDTRLTTEVNAAIDDALFQPPQALR